MPPPRVLASFAFRGCAVLTRDYLLPGSAVLSSCSLLSYDHTLAFFYRGVALMDGWIFAFIHALAIDGFSL